MTDPVAPPAGTPPAGTPPAGTPPASTPPSPAWYATHPDEAVRGWAETKGLPDPMAALSTAFHAEKLIGHERAGRTLVIPADENDAPAWQKVHERLGWSADVAAYKLPVPDGADPKFAADMAGLFQKHHIPVKNAQAIAADWNAYQAAHQNQQQAAVEAAAAAEDAQLSKDWGSERAARTEIARRGAIAMGFKAEHIDALQKVAGFSTVMKAMAKIGDTLSEHGAENIKPGSFGMTPEGAKSRKTQLMADKEWGAKAMKKDSAEWAELTRLDQIIASAQTAA